MLDFCCDAFFRVLLGVYSGLKGGWIDQALTKVIDAMMTFPRL